MRTIFVDANILIYLFEDRSELAELAARLLRRIEQRGDALCTSTLVAAEVRTGARLMGDESLEFAYRALFASPEWRLLPFAVSTVDHFVRARLLPGVKAPDAIHLACAAEHEVDVFLTHDSRLAGQFVPGIGFIVDLHTDIFGGG
jgi:predicted nucleic acid-binding protein